MEQTAVLTNTKGTKRLAARPAYVVLALIAAFLCFIAAPKLASAVSYPITIDETTFPDATFRQYVRDNLNNGSAVLTQARAEAVKTINVYYKGVDTLQGVEYFPNVEDLTCNYNNLTALDVSSNTALTNLSCGYNNLTALDVSSNTALEYLSCDNNDNLTALDLSNNTALRTVSCRHNSNLAVLDVSGCVVLGFLDCERDKLTTLDVSNNTALTFLMCRFNDLTTLDVSNNIALTHLYCNNNNLTVFDISSNTVLAQFEAQGNNLIDLNRGSSVPYNTNVYGYQTRTIPVIPDPVNPGSYMSQDIYAFELGHSISVANATYRADTQRFYTSIVNTNQSFTTDIGSGYTVQGTIVFAADTTAPVLTAGMGTRTAAATGTAGFSSDRAGTYYYAVVESGAAAPAVDTSGTGTPMTVGTQTISLAGLTANTAKDIYIQAKDAVTGNLSNTVKVVVPAFTPPVTPVIADGVYVIRTIDALSPTKVVEVPAQSLADGTKISIWDENRVAHQRFIFTRDADGYYTIKNLNSGKVLDVPGSNIASKVQIIQWTAGGTDNQKWAVAQNPDGSYTISPKLDPKLCLDVYESWKGNGTAVIIFPNNNTSNQRFVLQKMSPVLADGIYTIAASYVDLVLDVHGGGRDNGTNVQLWAPHGQGSQKFTLTYDVATGYYTIINPQSGKVLDVTGASTAKGTNVEIWEPHGGKAQQWAIEVTGDGTYRLYAACSGLVLDAVGSGRESGTNVVTWTDNNTANQKWKFTAVE